MSIRLNKVEKWYGLYDPRTGKLVIQGGRPALSKIPRHLDEFAVIKGVKVTLFYEIGDYDED